MVVVDKISTPRNLLVLKLNFFILRIPYSTEISSGHRSVSCPCFVLPRILYGKCVTCLSLPLILWPMVHVLHWVSLRRIFRGMQSSHSFRVRRNFVSLLFFPSLYIYYYNSVSADKTVVIHLVRNWIFQRKKCSMVFLNGSFKQILGSNSVQIFLSVHQKSKVVLIMCSILYILRTQMLKGH